MQQENNTVDYYNVGTSIEDLYVSSSSLKHINPDEGGSPANFKSFIEGGQDISDKPYIQLGQHIHTWHEDRENFAIAEVPKPTEKLGEIADKIIELVQQGNIYDDALVKYVIESTNYQANWKMETRITKVNDGTFEYINEVLEAKENNQIFMTVSEAEKVQNATEAIQNHPAASKLIFVDQDFSDLKHFKELIIIREIAIGETRLKLKSRIDNITIDVENRVVKLVDLKTTSQGVHAYLKSFKHWRTYRQLAFYKSMLSWWVHQTFGGRGWRFEYYIIGVETNKLQQCVVYRIDSQWIKKGSEEAMSLLHRIAYHKHTGNWSWTKEELEGDYILNIPYEEDTKV